MDAKEEIEQRKKQQVQQEKNETIDLVIMGRNNIFKKEYDLPELRLKINLVVKYPTIREQALIEALRSDFLKGTDQNYFVNRKYEALFTIQENGKDTKVYTTDADGNIEEEIPNYFSLDGYARPDILNMVAEDLSVWMSRFRG